MLALIERMAKESLPNLTFSVGLASTCACAVACFYSRTFAKLRVQLPGPPASSRFAARLPLSLLESTI